MGGTHTGLPGEVSPFPGRTHGGGHTHEGADAGAVVKQIAARHSQRARRERGAREDLEVVWALTGRKARERREESVRMLGATAHRQPVELTCCELGKRCHGQTVVQLIQRASGSAASCPLLPREAAAGAQPRGAASRKRGAGALDDGQRGHDGRGGGSPSRERRRLRSRRRRSRSPSGTSPAGSRGYDRARAP